MNKFYTYLVLLFTLFVATGNAQNCQAYFAYSNSAGTSVQFIDSSWTNSGNLNYYWDFGNGDSSSLSNPAYTFNQNGSYVVCLSITSSTGCQDTFCDTVQVGSIINPPPCSVSFIYNSDSLNNTFFTSFVNGTTPYTYNWNFGDGSPNSTQANPVHAYNTPGAYGVTLTVNSAIGSTCIAYDTVFVNTCNAFFISSNPILGTVNFTNYSTAAPQTIYLWNFGDGSPSVQQHHASHTYLSSGTYTVSLTSFDSLNLCTNTYYDSIQILLPPNCQANFNYTLSQRQVTLQNTATGFTSLSYDFGDGSSSTAINPIHNYSQNGTYIICQTVINSNSNCTNTFCDSIVINVTPPCIAGFNFTISQGTVFITSTAQNNTNTNYNFGDGGSSNFENPTYSYMQSGNYMICQTVSNNLGCIDSICHSINITVTPPCSSDFSYSSNEDTLRISDLSSNSDSVFYDYGDGNSTPNNIHIYGQSGTYQVCQTVFGANGCIDSTCTTVSILIPNCNAEFSSIQRNDTIFISNLATNYTSISYDFGDGTITGVENPSHLYINSGTYIVKQTVMNVARGCVDIFYDTLLVNISTSCVSAFQIAIDTNNLNTLYLVNTSTNDNTHRYNWSFGDGSFGTGRLPTHFYSDFGAHEVCLTISDSIMNCSSTFCDTVGLDSNGNIVKAAGYTLKVLEGDFIGIPDLSTSFEELSIYPNPFQEIIRLEYAGKGNLSYNLRHLNGSLISSGIVKNKEIKIPDIPPGIYLIQITNGVKTNYKKIIKER
jgi:PKD repeat protein